ncbi:ral guanine nucleotide dissociation stimulator-like protein, partial [Camelus ferus]
KACSSPSCVSRPASAQTARAMTSILGTWLHQYPEDFLQPPGFPCLKPVLAYIELSIKPMLAYRELSMPGSGLEHWVQFLLAELEHLELPDAEGD